MQSTEYEDGLMPGTTGTKDKHEVVWETLDGLVIILSLAIVAAMKKSHLKAGLPRRGSS
jgi:hypothetical protein